MQHLNLESRLLYERQLKEHKEQLQLTNAVDAVPLPEHSEAKAPDCTDGTSQNISSPNTQNIPSPNSQNISDTQTPEHSAPSILEPPSPSQISSTVPRQASLPPASPSTDHDREQQGTVGNLNPNNLTMIEALELFELMHANAKRARETHQPSTIEASQVKVASERAEPLSFLTLQTVEGIVDSTDIEISDGRNSCESKMEKLISLGEGYSSTNTMTGEKCYMVDESLFRNILLAVAARKQNEQSLVAATEKLEQHIERVWEDCFLYSTS